MREMLAGYSLLSLFSFCCFFTLFITIANAQTADTQSTPTIVAEPTPTLFFRPTDTPTPWPTIAPTQTPTPLPAATPTPQPRPKTDQPLAETTLITDLETLFTMYATFYQVDREQLKKIARCESSFNPQAVNGDYVGMFQFATQTWIGKRTQMGLDPNPDLRRNAEESIKTTAYMLSLGQQNAWPNCK